MFYISEGLGLPVSAWCLRYIVDYARDISTTIMGIQALYLHSVPSAESFYSANGFSYIPHLIHPLYSIDADFRMMWLSLYTYISETLFQVEQNLLSISA